MKKLIPLLTATLLFTPLAIRGAETAQGRMYCLSLRFQQGEDETGWFTLDLTTINSKVNGELKPLQNNAYSHGSGLYWNGPIFQEPIPGTMHLNTPGFADANSNGFADFFEVSQGVTATSSGIFEFDSGESGTVQAQWSRSAGSKDGTCVLSLEDDVSGPLGDFTHHFELIEYTGPLSYTPAVDVVAGAVNFAQTGNPANTLQGPIQFVKSVFNPSNELWLQPGIWTNAALQLFTFSNDFNPFQRNLSLATNYQGSVYFVDGEPNTREVDFAIWVLSIDDLNDTDHDGIPDFSDDPQTTPPRQSTLTLTRGATNLWLTISGDVGHPCDVQEINSLLSTNWKTVLSVTLTNDPQTISLSLPATAVTFWRAVMN